MSFSILRFAENDDLERVRVAAERFCRAHKIEFVTGQSAARIAIATRIYNDSAISDTRIRDAWQREFCKSLSQDYSPSLDIQGNHIGHCR